MLPGRATDGAMKLAATVDDFAAMANISPFGMCTTQANPQVAAATTAAQGVLTPQPCVPVTTSPWSPGATTSTISGRPALVASDKASCAWTGSIEVADPGSTINVE